MKKPDLFFNWIRILALNTLLNSVAIALYAQSEFQKGYVLLINGDTLHGEIDNRDYISNASICYFRKTRAEPVTTYLPGQIAGYQLTNGKYYVSKQIEEEKEKMYVFLEYLIDGKLDVYFYQDPDGNHYFISNDTLPITELKYTKGIKRIGDKSYSYESKTHLALLNYYTGNSPELKQNLDALHEPNHKNLIKIAEKYHNQVCTDSKCIIYEKKLPLLMKYGISGGSTVFFKNALDDSDKILVSPTFGFNFFIQQPEISERFHLGLGFICDGLVDEVKPLLRIPLSFNYIHPKQGFSPTFSFGIDLNSFAAFQFYKAGVKYQVKRLSVLLQADIKTFMVIARYATSQEIAITFDIR